MSSILVNRAVMTTSPITVLRTMPGIDLMTNADFLLTQGVAIKYNEKFKN